MSDQKLVSPLLDGFVLGNPMSTHNGIQCCPAIKENSDEKYIVKRICVPASQVQLEALLLTGAYRDPADAMDYFKEVADGIADEADILTTLSRLEGFLPFEELQIIPMEDGKLGYEVYLLSTYRRSLLRYMHKNPVTHLDAINMGLDICAALAICRRAGYLYVDLKPSNIFLSRGRQFRIGDLGFVKLDSLSYTSLASKYRSPYSPREVQDDLKTLNDTVDTYAVGMILYQIYNDGNLPVSPLEPRDSFPHPANADYEISSIIMKALDPDPAKRWKDPMEMGQALVGYMQRNTVNNVPIMPPSGIPLNTDDTAATVITDTDESQQPVVTPEEAAAAIMDLEEIPETSDAVPLPEKSLVESPEPQTSDPDEENGKKEYGDDEEDEDADLEEDFSIVFHGTATEEEPVPTPTPRKPAPTKKKRKPVGKGIIILLIVLLFLSCICCGGMWLYQSFYLQNIDNLTLEGTQNALTVFVDTEMDTSLLEVSCTDAYGNSIIRPVENGQAVFTDLLPDSLYRIELTVNGFHELTGKTAEIFTTEALPTIISMSAITGPEDGSVIVNFTVDGADLDQWVITCRAEGEETITETFSGHSVTIRGLSVGSVYTLELGSTDGVEIRGEHTVEFSSGRLIMAENLVIADCVDGIMTVRWDAPADCTVEKWKVRCYNDDGHEEVLEIGGTEISFTDIDSSKEYTVEVTAAGMTKSSRVSITANPLTITGFSVGTDDPDNLTVNWDFTGAAPDGGWLLLYTLDGQGDQPNVIKCEGTSAVIDTRIPSTRYEFTLQAADSTSVFNNIHSFTCPAANIFDMEGLSAGNISGYLLVTPDSDDWSADSLKDTDYKNTFQSGESISVVLKAHDNFYLPSIELDVMYVIRNGDGNVLSKYISRETQDWKELWYAGNYHNGELTIPKIPTEPGDYSVSIYFNNLAVTVINFTIE